MEQEMNYLESVALAVDKLMRKDKKCIYLGEDVRSGQRGISVNFLKKYGKKRVLDTPISESGFCGFALGAAIAGFKPIVEFNFAGLVFVSMDQIFNQASKFKQMSGGKKNVPIIYLLPTGTKGGLAGHHSDNPYSVLAHLGIKSYMPSHASEVESIINLAYSKKEPVAIFLATEEFRNNRKIKKTNKAIGLKKLYSKKNKTELAIICTGTSIDKSINALEYFDNKIKSKCSLFGLNDLSIDQNTEKKILNIKSNKFLIVDDSPSKFGLSSQIELLLRKNRNIKKNNILVVTRKSNFIPFNEKLENDIRPTQLKIKNKISQMLNN
tara:strand:- start:15171 stop:16142 length:972 start_codon:yes stop_codon:yes gene_type:complete